MRIETGIPISDWRSIAPAAQRAEALGFDGITMPEIANDPFTPLAFAALATERMQLGTAIAVAFPRSPMVVANLAWDLQVNSRGPLRARARRRRSRVTTSDASRCRGGAGAAAARVHRVAARDLALLGTRRTARLRGRSLSLHADDAGVLAARERHAADAR